MSELKPCPFCGISAHLTEYEDQETAWCHSCDIEKLVRLWNSRPIEDALQKRIEELKSALHKIATAHVPLYASEAYLIQLANDAIAAAREGK